jgi:cysteine desulfuration protein SufE
MLPPLDEILETFALIDDWEEKYRYVIELGRQLPPFPEEERTDANKVLGCASQVWLTTHVEPGPGGPVVRFDGDSDAHIVRGLVALMLAVHSGKTPEAILATDALSLFKELGLSAHLTPQRSNGVRSMMERIRREAIKAQAQGAGGAAG